MPFREAHEVTGRIVIHCVRKKKSLSDLKIGELKKFSGLIGQDIYPLLTAEGSVAAKRSRGGTSPGEVKRQIARLKKAIADKK